MPADWARHTAKLPPPDGGAGGAVYVLGGAHVSAAAAEEAAALIRALQPATVVVELDPARYERLLAAQRLGIAASGAEVASRGSGAVQLLSLAWKGELPAFALALAYAAAGALFGSEPGAEFAAAIAAAHEVGATVVLGDRDASVTIARIKARLRAARDDARTAAGAAPATRDAPRGEEDAEVRVTRSLSNAGCERAGAALLAAKRLLRDALADTGGGVRPDDLAAVRACAVGIIETTREHELRRAAPAVLAAGGEPPALPPAAHAAASSSGGEDGLGVFSMSPDKLPTAISRTLVGERDLLLARALQLPSAGGEGQARTTVGVVGAGHVAGIAAEWASARSPDGYARAAEYALPLPADATPPGIAAALPRVAFAAGAALLAVRRPGLFTKLVAAGAGASGMLAAVGAASVRQAARAIERVHRADEQLRETVLLGVDGDA